MPIAFVIGTNHIWKHISGWAKTAGFKMFHFSIFYTVDELTFEELLDSDMRGEPPTDWEKVDGEASRKQWK